MLYGQYQHNLDLKGRVTVPSKFREFLGDVFFVSVGLKGCLYVYSKDEWDKFINNIANSNVGNAKKFQKIFTANCVDVETDKQGRILIPQMLREYAGLTKEVSIIGNRERAEIWDKEKWKVESDSMKEELLSGDMEDLIL